MNLDKLAGGLALGIPEAEIPETAHVFYVPRINRFSERPEAWKEERDTFLAWAVENEIDLLVCDPAVVGRKWVWKVAINDARNAVAFRLRWSEGV